LGVELDAEAAATELGFAGVELEDAEAVERGGLVGHDCEQCSGEGVQVGAIRCVRCWRKGFVWFGLEREE
jgi:hypothetical protein